MCCKTSVQPLDRLIAETILTIGQFTRTASGWERTIPVEETRVVAHFTTDSLDLSLQPSVSSMEGHHAKRLAAGVMYEIAARYAEKVGGQVVQRGINVPLCMEAGLPMRVLASYPSQRLDFGRLCVGFQDVFLGGSEEQEPIAYG